MVEKARVAVVGATGAVGREMLHCLEALSFPVGSIRLAASKRSAGKKIQTPWGESTVCAVEDCDFSDIDIALFSAGGAVSLAHAPRAVSQGAFVIDNTSAFRMQNDIALIVPEINPECIPESPSIIANPNCSTIQMVLALKAIQDVAGLESVRVATYQSCSGAGQKGIDALLDETKLAIVGARPNSSRVHARCIAFDVVPQIGAMNADGDTEEELKMMNETRKILKFSQLRISATCVRVPVLRGHSEVVSVVTRRPLSVEEAREALSKMPGLVLTDGDDVSAYPTATQCEGRFETLVGRVRKDHADPNGLVFWIVSDNLLKGAALNAVQIAQIVWNRKNGIFQK